MHNKRINRSVSRHFDRSYQQSQMFCPTLEFCKLIQNETFKLNVNGEWLPIGNGNRRVPVSVMSNGHDHAFGKHGNHIHYKPDLIGSHSISSFETFIERFFFWYSIKGGQKSIHKGSHRNNILVTK